MIAAILVQPALPICLFVIVLAGLLPMFLKQVSSTSTVAVSPKISYRKKEHLLNTAEQSFYETLSAAIAPQCSVFTKVRLFDLVDLPHATHEHHHHPSRTLAKHVGFVVCDRRGVAPLLVIELDDQFRQSAGQAGWDPGVREVLSDAGLPLLHLPANAVYSPQELARIVRQTIADQTGAQAASDQPARRVASC